MVVTFDPTRYVQNLDLHFYNAVRPQVARFSDKQDFYFEIGVESQISDFFLLNLNLHTSEHEGERDEKRNKSRKLNEPG